MGILTVMHAVCGCHRSDASVINSRKIKFYESPVRYMAGLFMYQGPDRITMQYEKYSIQSMDFYNKIL